MVISHSFEKIKIQDVTLEGDLALPESKNGIVIFAHGSGSSRHSPRNKYVADFLQQNGLGTLLVDLLTQEEEQAEALTRHIRFNIRLLADRLVALADWVQSHPELKQTRIGFFGASTGGGAALVAAANRTDLIDAVVSRGGRPDLAGDALPNVRAATLLIVGGYDFEVIRMNQWALNLLNCEKRLILIPGASHLFEEPGRLEQVAQHARSWFSSHLTRA